MHPCAQRRMRIAVADVLGWLAAGMTHQAILADYPELTEDDIRACLACAADRERRLLTAARSCCSIRTSASNSIEKLLRDHVQAIAAFEQDPAATCLEIL